MQIDLQKLRIARKRAQLRQRDLAEAVGVQTFTVSRWETGRIAIDASHFDKICEVLGVELTDILQDTPASRELSDFAALVARKYDSAPQDVKMRVIELLENVKLP